MAGATFVLENGKEIAARIASLGEFVQGASRREFGRFGRDVAQMAKTVHRHNDLSSDLDKSIHYKTDEKGLGVEIWADLGLAPYARRIHYGWGTWAADKYLENAFNKFAAGLGDRIHKAIARAIEKAKK
jgi:hypothetical protein